jgi:hypothetical protein
LCGAAIVELVMEVSIPESALTFLFGGQVRGVKFALFRCDGATGNRQEISTWNPSPLITLRP